MRAFMALLAAGFVVCAQPAPNVGELIKRTGERFFALENFDVDLTIGHLGDPPSERKLRIALRDDDSLLLDTKTGYVTIVRDGRLIRIRDLHREWTETPAEGPPLRSLQRQIEPYITRFEKLVAVNFEMEFVKWEELKRGGKRVKCAVVRMRPRSKEEGRWKETLWIDPEDALVWRSLWEENRLGAGGADSTPRQVDYDWRASHGQVADGVFESEKLKKYKRVNSFSFSPGMGATLPAQMGQ